MSRTLTTAVALEVAKPKVRYIFLAELVFSSGTVRAWTGIGTLTWAGQSWIGTGSFGGVSQVEEASDFQATNISFSLSGIPSEYIALVLADAYQGKSAKLWKAYLDDNAAIIADPFQLFAGRLDVATITETGDTCSIAITAESELADLKRSRESRYTDAEQQRKYPGDLGLQYITQAASKEINWGRPYVSSGASYGGGDSEGGETESQ